ncbi:MAG: glycosyl hydrolase family 28 protein [Bacteroidales bacterium]
MRNKTNISFLVVAFVMAFFPMMETPAKPLFTDLKPDITVKEGEVQVYNYPRICPKNIDFKLRAGGKEIFVYNTSAEPFAAFSCNGAVDIEIELPYESDKISINPKKHGIKPVISGKKVSFQIPGPINLALEIDGMPKLYIYANAIEKKSPNIKSPNVKFFKAGQVYEVGELRLQNNDTLYIEGGAVVRGCIRSTSAQNVCITGFGVLDGSYYSKGEDSHRSIVFEDCKNSTIENIIMIEPTSWMIVLGICENITIRNVKELGLVSGSDGTDIVGSKKIRIENCIYRNGDDCIAVKSLDLRGHGHDATLDYSQDVDNIEISGCTFIAFRGGTALEIGHELRTASIRNIMFTDCDILGVHDFGGVFGIHNSDRAIVSEVLYENIRVEHYYNKLIDLKVIKSMWGKDAERGQIRNITFRNINIDQTIYNPGYSMSLIGGYDAQHTVKTVKFENVILGGSKVVNADQLDLYVKQASEITFK